LDEGVRNDAKIPVLKALPIVLLISCSKGFTNPKDSPPRTILYGPVVLKGNQSLSHAIVDGGDTGIIIDGSNITIDNVAVRESRSAGIAVRYNDWPNISKYNIQLTNTTVSNTIGIEGQLPHTGDGIVLSGVKNAIIYNCKATKNGYIYGAGNIGIWAYDSKNVTIDRCTSILNKSPNGPDGGGFGLDGGVSNSRITNCISEKNEGAGYLPFEYGSPNTWGNNVIDNCESNGDGLSSPYSSFTIGVWGSDKLLGGLVISNCKSDKVIPVTWLNKHQTFNILFVNNSW
jgi:hypothetical protein